MTGDVLQFVCDLKMGRFDANITYNIPKDVPIGKCTCYVNLNEEPDYFLVCYKVTCHSNVTYFPKRAAGA